MRNSLTQKGNSSFLSISPFSYAVELTAESPLFNFWERTPNPLADCVKSASILLLGMKNLFSLFWRYTVLTWARLKHTLTPNAPSRFLRAGAWRIATVNSVASLILRVEPCYCWKTIKI